jgi:hypothetical protein
MDINVGSWRADGIDNIGVRPIHYTILNQRTELRCRGARNAWEQERARGDPKHILIQCVPYSDSGRPTGCLQNSRCTRRKEWPSRKKRTFQIDLNVRTRGTTNAGGPDGKNIKNAPRFVP